MKRYPMPPALDRMLPRPGVKRSGETATLWDDLIEQAHEDAIHVYPNSVYARRRKESLMIEGFFSNIECECGCHNLMPEKLVKRGWHYLRGHKPGVLIHTITKAKTLNQGKAPKAGPVVSMDKSRAVALFRSDLLLLMQQAVEVSEQIAQLQVRGTTLQKQVMQQHYGLRLLAPDALDDKVEDLFCKVTGAIHLPKQSEAPDPPPPSHQRRRPSGR